MSETTTTEVVQPYIGADGERVVYADPEMAPIKGLKQHPRNPRKGDVDAVAESLQANGQFRPVLVQRVTDDGKPNRICAGHHLVLAAKSLGWKEVGVVYLDVDDAAALRILLADNRTADLGSYDTAVLAEILRDVPEATVGTGFYEADVRAVLSAVQERDSDAVAKVLAKPEITVDWSKTDDHDEPETLEERLEEAKATVDARREAQKSLLGMDVVTEHANAAAEDKALAEIQNRLISLIMDNAVLKDPAPANNYWGIPEIRPDMLVDQLPDPIDTWARWDVTPDDGVTTWVYNYGVTNATKLPWDRTILSFFTWDERFMVWWNDPSWYTAKVLLAGCTMAIEPDFSMWGDDPRFNHLESHFRSQWLARFFQEAGMRVIPRIHFHDLESLRYALVGIPKQAPVVAICIQAGAGANRERAYEATETYDGLRQFVKEIDPGHLLVYGGNPAMDVVEKSHLPKSLPVTHILNFAGKRRGVVYDVARGAAALDDEDGEDE